MLDIDIEVRVLKSGRRRVIALSDFMPGDIIFTWDASTKLSEDQYAKLTAEQKAFVRTFEGAWTFMPAPMCYVQHSVDANAGSRRGIVIAIREIHSGEEITMNFEHPDA